MSDMQYPVYFWRYFQPYVAWFCTEDGARRFMDGASDLGQIAGESMEPFELSAGRTFIDVGHEHCWGDDCDG